MPEPSDFTRRIYERLLTSDRFQRYRQAFLTATGLPLRFVSADVDAWCLDDVNENRSPFCERINLCESVCGACRDVNRRLMAEAEVKGPQSCHCFSGMSATAVPVRHGSATIGFLKTGQVFQSTPTEKMFDSAIDAIGRKQFKRDEIENLRTAFMQTKSVTPERYQSMIDLLVIFADQLSKDADDAALIEDGREPETIKKAIAFINAHLADRLVLGDVASAAGASESHFCRIFKESTGLTFTDYVNHARIEWAKRELLRPSARVSEIAFLVGYQSLSQFNRSFARITGSSPSEFRREKLVKAG
ncbi:hypothetical protein HAHE_39650 [Haloferula helveola]|uniref:HTH araC/xylS-type domain-containing protein n=1 Tax=Haloferula helveola TaxID=490095 RepID=A0ABM7RJK9_9BACT|nr:hypothetical protein HAHE_39650 [Haloferula helveola]